MRLIDADELKKDLRKFLANDNHVNNPSTTYLDVLDVVEEQPTAYDIDKVVEELYEERTEILFSNDYESEIVNYCLDKFDRAIEIVEQGLKEQNK